MQDEIRIIAVQAGFSQSRQFIYGDYCISLKVAFDGKTFTIRAQKSYKNEEIRSKY